MPRKKLYEQKISEESFRVKPFERTVDYIKSRVKITGHKAHEIIREMLDTAHNFELSAAQFAGGTTKIFQSVMTKLIREIIGEPLAQNTAAIESLMREIRNQAAEIKALKRQSEQHEAAFSQYRLDAEFAISEGLRINRVIYTESQTTTTFVHRLGLKHEVKMDTVEERKVFSNLYDEEFEKRRNDYYTAAMRKIKS